jgi:hypothetical protein
MLLAVVVVVDDDAVVVVGAVADVAAQICSNALTLF